MTGRRWVAGPGEALTLLLIVVGAVGISLSVQIVLPRERPVAADIEARSPVAYIASKEPAEVALAADEPAGVALASEWAQDPHMGRAIEAPTTTHQPPLVSPQSTAGWRDLLPVTIASIISSVYGSTLTVYVDRRAKSRRAARNPGRRA